MLYFRVYLMQMYLLLLCSGEMSALSATLSANLYSPLLQNVTGQSCTMMASLMIKCMHLYALCYFECNSLLSATTEYYVAKLHHDGESYG